MTSIPHSVEKIRTVVNTHQGILKQHSSLLLKLQAEQLVISTALNDFDINIKILRDGLFRAFKKLHSIGKTLSRHSRQMIRDKMENSFVKMKLSFERIEKGDLNLDYMSIRDQQKLVNIIVKTVKTRLSSEAENMTASGLANRLLIGQEIQFIRIDDSDEAIKHMDNETLKEIKNYNMYANDSLLPYLLGNFVVINYIMIPKSITSNAVRLYRLVNIPQFLPNQNKAQQTKNLPETFGLAADGSFYEFGRENERNHNNERNNGNCIRGPITFCREHVLKHDMIINKCLAEKINNNHNNFPIQKGKTACETEQVLLDTPYSRRLDSNLWILSTNKELDCTSSQKTPDTQIPSSGGEDARRVHVTDMAILRTNCFQKFDCNGFTFYSGNHCDDVKKLGVINQQVFFEHRMEIAIPTLDNNNV
ncbi:unnamed protein product [Didymodactylos carnosus]|uniref:Uncharacterized protein n=2 Tax=Didymodactylos carnosus TaxID=1234261 RepID=A0A814UJN8_9BILA|nr:unnamed protein product [Didymodactylos carnosus]CAF3942140.1 unnamed protein product [Didymodactylos carnosus]